MNIDTKSASLDSPSDLFSSVPKIVHACHQRMGSPLRSCQLEEVVQITAVAVWRQAASFRGESAPTSWVYGIARRKILESIRAEVRRNDSDARLIADHAESDLATDIDRARRSASFWGVVEDSLNGEGTTVGEVFRRRFLDGESLRQIGAELGKNEAALKSRHRRRLPFIRERLRQLWIDYLAH